jgi:hypothetical protein
LPPAEHSRAGIATPVEVAVRAPGDAIVLVAAFAVSTPTLEPNLLRERSHRVPRLLPFDRPKPRADDFKHALYGRESFGYPLVVVRLAMALDMSDTEDVMQASQHRRRYADLAVLCRRRPDAIPRRGSDARPGASEPKAAFTVEKARSPCAIQSLPSGG